MQKNKASHLCAMPCEACIEIDCSLRQILNGFGHLFDLRVQTLFAHLKD